MDSQEIDKILPTIEKYVLSDHKQSFASSLKGLPEENFFSLITSSKEKEFDSLLKKAEIEDKTFRNSQWTHKIVDLLKSGANLKEKLQGLKSFRKIKEPNFDYAQPTQQSVSTPADPEKSEEIPDTLFEEDYSLEKLIRQKLNQKESVCKSLTELGLMLFPKKEISKLQKQEISVFEQDMGQCHLNEHIIPIISHLLQNYKEKKEVIVKVLQYLTIQQVKLLSQHFPGISAIQQCYSAFTLLNYVQENLNRLSSEKKSLKKSEILEKKKQLFLEAIKLLKQKEYSNTFVSDYSASYLTNYILKIDLMLSNYDVELFRQYLNNPIDISDLFTEKYQSVLSKKQQNSKHKGHSSWENYIQMNSRSWFEGIDQLQSEQLIPQYLKLYFTSNPLAKLKQFDKYFEKSKLEEIYTKAQLFRGQAIDSNQTVLANEDIQQFRDLTQLQFTKTNEEKFGIQDEVVLKIKVKNIETLTADIYEMNTLQLYLSGRGDMNAHLPVDFLKPTKTLIKHFDNSNPFKTTTFDFDLELDRRPGVYIVDFKGKNSSIRALIFKGGIRIVKKTTIVGVELQFYWQNGKKINELEVWSENKKITVKQKHIIPYGKEESTLRVIALKQGLAQVITLDVPKESYKLQIRCFYHGEGFIVGQKAKIFVRAQLTGPTEEPITLKMLKDSHIVVKITNHKDIESKLEFSSVEWDSENEYILQIPVVTHLNQIEISVKGKVDKYEGKPQIVQDTCDISFEEPSSSLTEMFLEKEKENYKLKVLGLNGQPKKRVMIRIVLETIHFFDKIPTTLITNFKGEVNLGTLKGIINISACFIDKMNTQSNSQEQYNRSWRIGDQLERNFPTQICVRSDQQFFIPLPLNYNPNLISLVKKSENIKVSETNKARIQNSQLMVQIKEAGRYELSLIALQTKIEIIVIADKQWESGTVVQDIQGNSLFSRDSFSHQGLITFGAQTIKRNKENYKIQVKLNTPKDFEMKNVRAHIFASTFLSENMFAQVLRQITHDRSASGERFQSPQCVYLETRTLSDEYCYVIARQQNPRKIGNNLQKPHILIKPLQLGPTKMQEQELEKGTQYKVLLNMENSRGKMRRKRLCAQKIARKTAPVCTGVSSNSNSGVQICSWSNNFLKYSASIKANIHTENNTISFSIPTHYQSCTVLITSPEFAIQKEFILQNLEVIPMRNLCHLGLQDSKESSGITVVRNIHLVRSGDALSMNQSSQWSAIGMNRVINFGLGQTSFSFLLEWPGYDYQKKQKVYDEFCCHEFNTYLKYRDPQFYGKVVHPFIANKLLKTIVDYCLLESEQCVDFADPTKLSLLNPFEKCLLVAYLSTHGHAQKARSIAASLRMTATNTTRSNTNFDGRFDTLLATEHQEYRQVFCAAPKAQMRKRSEASDDGCDEDQEQQNQSASKSRSRDRNEKAISKSTRGGKGGKGVGKVIPRGIKKSHRFRPGPPDSEEQMEYRNKYTPANFKSMDDTKQYIETTYYKVTDPSQSTGLIPESLFWADLAEHFVLAKNDFLSSNLIYLQKFYQILLSLAFLPEQPQFQIDELESQLKLAAKSSFLLLVKQIKSVEYNEEPSVLVHQRFIDPADQFVYKEDGTEVEKTVKEFIAGRRYSCQTVFTNISAARLKVQALIDCPKGSIPVDCFEYTSTNTLELSPFSIRSIRSEFYFPEAGCFTMYPANIAINGKVVAKAEEFGVIEVKLAPTQRVVQTFEDALRTDSKQEILTFIREKNIFNQDIFNPEKIFYLLKDKSFYEAAIKIFKDRSFFDETVWSFSLMHSDLQTATSYIIRQQQSRSTQLLEYFPLNSNRAHKFMKQSKGTILNITFRETYRDFLVATSLDATSHNSVKMNLTLAYYLILQDRVPEADAVFKRITPAGATPGCEFPQLQYDYMCCFLDMHAGYPNFVKARELSGKYREYPVPSWRRLFVAVHELLNQHDSTMEVEDSSQQVEMKYQVIGNTITVTLPEKTTLEVNFYSANLELIFSAMPFEKSKILSIIKPSKTTRLATTTTQAQFKIQRPTDLSDVFVGFVEERVGNLAKIHELFFWENDSLKVKVQEDHGMLVAYLDGKAKPGAYCKVFIKVQDEGEAKFLKDGYTDLKGKFHYIDRMIDEIEKIAILITTENGGVIKEANKPSKVGKIQ